MPLGVEVYFDRWSETKSIGTEIQQKKTVTNPQKKTVTELFSGRGSGPGKIIDQANK
jgi:hypothetical protein